MVVSSEHFVTAKIGFLWTIWNNTCCKALQLAATEIANAWLNNRSRNEGENLLFVPGWGTGLRWGVEVMQGVWKRIKHAVPLGTWNHICSGWAGGALLDTLSTSVHLPAELQPAEMTSQYCQAFVSLAVSARHFYLQNNHTPVAPSAYADWKPQVQGSGLAEWLPYSAFAGMSCVLLWDTCKQ